MKCREPRIGGLGVARPSALVLVLHGGRPSGHGRAHRLRPAYLRMWPFSRELARAGRSRGLSVGMVRYRYRGWNGADADPLRDAEWALAGLAGRHPGVPVVLLGHSMGARAALWAAGHSSVVAVCALAPWVEEADPVDQLVDRTVLIAHGERDRITDPARSYAFAVRAKRVSPVVCRFELPGGHAMLRRRADWGALVRHFVLAVCGVEPMAPALAAAFAGPVPAGLRIRYPATDPARADATAVRSTGAEPAGSGRVRGWEQR